jgi:zinc and cadmium transporter
VAVLLHAAADAGAAVGAAAVAPWPVWRDALAAVGVVSTLPVVGMALLARDEARVRRVVPHLVAFAVGALVGGACFHLLPEAYARAAHTADGGARVPLVALAGFVTFLVLEWLLHGRHDHHGHAGHSHALWGLERAPDGAHAGTPAGHAHAAAATARQRALVTLTLAGDALHNLLDGVLVAATFLTAPAVGVLTTVAVSLHELPRELGTFGVFVHGGVPVRRAVAFNVATGLLAATGAVLTLVLGPRVAGLAGVMLPFAAGNFLYIAASLLAPLARGPHRLPARTGAARAALVALGLAATALPAFWG